MRVRNLEEFKPLREYLQAEQTKHTTFLIGCNEDRPMHVAQGMLRAISGLNELIDKAPAALEQQVLAEQKRRT